MLFVYILSQGDSSYPLYSKKQCSQWRLWYNFFFIRRLHLGFQTRLISFLSSWVRMRSCNTAWSTGSVFDALGLAQCAELCWQLRGEAGKRQVPGAKLALQHNLGLGGAVVVSLYRMGFPETVRWVLSPPWRIHSLPCAIFVAAAVGIAATSFLLWILMCLL